MRIVSPDLFILETAEEVAEARERSLRQFDNVLLPPRVRAAYPTPEVNPNARPDEFTGGTGLAGGSHGSGTTRVDH